MLFWVISVAMALLVLAVVLRPMFHDSDDAPASPDVDIYKAQLAEVDRDLARDVLAPDEADRARAEVARRLLAADAVTRAAQVAPPAVTRMIAALTVLGVVGVAVWSYASIGAPGEPDQPLAQRLAQSELMRSTRPDQAALAAAAPPLPAVGAPEEYLQSVAELRVLMATRPDDQAGWELLAFHEAELRNFSAAAVAQQRVIDIKGDPAEIEDLRILMDLMVTATNGIVSPEAEAVARRILAQDAENTPALYYMGALYDQTGRHDLAFRFWRPIVESGEDTFHTALARNRIEATAEMAGLSYTAPPLNGPSLADIEAAEDMTADDRNAMIAGMVAGLADRLATEGGGPADWARLITAYGVLGDTENAAIVWTEAADVFGADATAMDVLREAAASAGVLE